LFSNIENNAGRQKGQANRWNKTAGEITAEFFKKKRKKETKVGSSAGYVKIRLALLDSASQA